MKYKNGETAVVGDVIRWNVWDADDFTTWKRTGLVKDSGVLYLGGGIDFGRAIGKMISFDDVIDQSEGSDDAGIEKIGVAADLVRYISKFNA